MATEDTLSNFDIQQLPKANVFLSKIQTLQDQQSPVLDDFKKYYVFYNKNPEYDEYHKMFDNINSNIHTINSGLSSVIIDVNSNTEDINKIMEFLNVFIRREKAKNKQLKRKLGRAEEKQNGSDEMVSNYKELYEIDYLRNWAMLLGTIVLSFALFKTRKPSQLRSM